MDLSESNQGYPEENELFETENETQSIPGDIHYPDSVLKSIRLINKHIIQSEVTEDLELEDLYQSHNEANERIAKILNQIEELKTNSESLDRQLYDNNEIQEQVLASYQKTEEIVSILKNEFEEFKKNFSAFSVIETNLKEKVGVLKNLQRMKDENEEIIAVKMEESKDLEKLIESLCSEALVKENEELKITVKQKQENRNIAMMRKKLIKELMEEKMNLMEVVLEKEKSIQLIKMERDIKWKEIEQFKMEEMEKIGNAENKLNETLNKKNLLSAEHEKCNENCKRNERQIENTKDTINGLEKEKQILKQKLETKQRAFDESNKTIKDKLWCKQQYLSNMEKDLETVLAEIDQYQKFIDDKQAKLKTSQDEHNSLLTKLEAAKLKQLNMEKDNLQQQCKNASIFAKLAETKGQLEELKLQKLKTEEKIAESEKILLDLQQEINDTKSKMRNKHIDEINVLMKQVNYNNATIDFINNRLNITSNEYRQLSETNTEIRNDLKLLEMKSETQDRTLQCFKENLKRKETELQSLEAQLQQGMPLITKKVSNDLNRTNQNETIISDTFVKGKPGNDDDLLQIIELEGVESTIKQDTGRKSPGILKTSNLKTPKIPSRPQTPSKKVKFQNVSSTSSASTQSENINLNVNSKCDEILNVEPMHF